MTGQPAGRRTLFRDLSLEELHAAQAELYRRIAALTDSGIPRREAELRIIAESGPIIEGEPIADTALRFAVLPLTLEDRVAVLEAAVALLARKLFERGDLTVNDVRAVHGLPEMHFVTAAEAGTQP